MTHCSFFPPDGRDQDATSSLWWQMANRMMTSNNRQWLHRIKVCVHLEDRKQQSEFTSYQNHFHISCFYHSPMIRHHHILSGCGLGSSGWPQSNGVRAKGQSHLLHQRVQRTRRVHPRTGPRHLPRLYREKLRRVFVLLYLWGPSLTKLC